MNYVKQFLSKIKTTMKDIRQMKKVRELFLYPKEQTITNISFFLVMLWMLSPIYRLLNSVTLQFHDPSFYFVNDSMLARDLSHYLQQIGYFGLFIGLFTISRSIIYAKDSQETLKQYVKKHIIPILLLIFLILSFFSALFSTNQSISFYGNPYRKEGLITYLAYTGLFISAYQLHKKQTIKCLLFPIVFSAFLLSIFSIIDITAINNLFTLTKQTSIFHNANHYAYFLNIMVMSTMALILIDQKRIIYIKILYFIVLATLTYTLVDNGSFGSYIGATFGLLFLTIFLLLYHPKEKLVLLFIIITYLSSSLLASYDTNFLSNELTKIVDNTGDIIEGNDEAPSAGSGRWSLWTNAVIFTFEKPIFGYGVDNLGERYILAGNTSDRPHNEYLQIAASIGLPGLITYLSVLAIHFLTLLKRKAQMMPMHIALYSILFAYLVGAFFGNSMYYTTPYYIIILALSISLNHKKTSE